MTNTFRVIDYDIIYLSYDEPNAEQNYADLCKKVPWAERIHGVKGSDSAHKAAAEKSTTDRFITIDGDNRIHDSFLTQSIDFDENTDLSNDLTLKIGNFTQTGIFHYTEKDFVNDEIIHAYEKHLGIS